MKKDLIRLAKSDDRTYSARATVIQTYRVKDQLDLYNKGLLPIPYDPVLHLSCDVRLTNDGTIVYGVRLSPHILVKDSSGNYTETVYDGTTESPTGQVPVLIPLTGSYVFISWLDKNTAFVAMQTNAENIIVGSTEGAYFDFYNREATRVLDLKNADEFNITLNNGKVFNIKTDAKDYTTFLVLLERIILSTTNASIIIETVDNVPTIKIATDGGKISMYNDVENLKTILTDFIDSFIKYINAVTPGLSVADPSLTPQLTQVVTDLNTLKTRLDTLFN